MQPPPARSRAIFWQGSSPIQLSWREVKSRLEAETLLIPIKSGLLPDRASRQESLNFAPRELVGKELFCPVVRQIPAKDRQLSQVFDAVKDFSVTTFIEDLWGNTG